MTDVAKDISPALNKILIIELTTILIKITISFTHIFVDNPHPYVLKAKLVGYWLNYLLLPIFLIVLFIFAMVDPKIPA